MEGGEKKASQLAERLGSAMPHASRAGTWSGRSALAMMERRAARERGAPWRGMSMDVANYARTGAYRREVTARSGK